MPFSFHTLLMALVPIFVSIDALGSVPLFLGMTEGMEPRARRRLVTEASLTAATVALIFVVSGKLIFSLLGITENDFRIGGGIVLVVMAVTELLFPDETRRDPESSVGIVPIGIPLIMGPAALTSIIIVTDTYGYWLATVSLALNLLFVWVVFRNAAYIHKLIGSAGSRALAKVAWLLLVAIAVMMIRVGIQNIMHLP
jgi:multiple antibiotic resistance protein